MSKVLKTIVNVILFCAIVVAAGLLIPPFAGITTVMVDDVDMQTNLPQGSVAYAVEKDRSELKQGDKVLISQEGRQYVYVVDSIDGSGVVLDDQLSTDGGTTQQELGSTVQKVMLVVPVIGYVSMALRSTEGLIIVGLAVVFVIILFILAEVWKKDDDEEEDEENEDAQEDEPEEEEPAVMSRRQKKKARKADKKKQKQEEKAAVAEAKARAKRERQEAKLAKKNQKAHMMDESEQEPEAIPTEPMEETQAAGSTQEIVLPTEETQEKQESTDETEDPDKTLLQETASLFAADIASMMSENQTKETEEPEETDPLDSTEQTQPVVLGAVSEEKQETGDKKLAMPVYSKEELLQKAEADGDEPEVIEDEVSGVTLVDYSDVL
jgi:chemotaxis protein histidine kinase CheA